MLLIGKLHVSPKSHQNFCTDVFLIILTIIVEDADQSFSRNSPSLLYCMLGVLGCLQVCVLDVLACLHAFRTRVRYSGL